MLESSPIAGFERAYDGPVDPQQLTTRWQQVLPLYGLVRSYGRTYNSPTRPGGFTIYAHEFSSRTQAVAGAIQVHRIFVCDFGADPYTLTGRPGVVVAIRPSDATAAWWIHDRRLIEVNYSMYRQHQRDLADALTVVALAHDRA